MSDDLEKLGRRIERERAARKEAEQLLERKSRELFDANQELRKMAAELEVQVAERTAQLSGALEQARFANEAKSQFLAKVSHELRTPLNAVTGYGYLLGKTGLDTRQSAYLEQITASSQQLLGLISDVLDLARIEAGQQSVTPAPFTLGALLDSALDVVRPAAQASGIELVCDDTRHLPQQLLGDEGLIKQALLNLLSNAVKFTERGQVRLQVRVLSDGPATGGSSHLRFEVDDTGAGIAPDRLGELFQPFAQLRADKRGTGLGLDITRRIVELMGGEVGVHSTLGQGSCFWFSVPLELDAQQTTPQVKPLTPQAAQESPGELAVQALSARHAGKTILVAEDDIINQDLIQLMLEGVGLEVAIAGDGEQALQMARAGHYAAVLMDLQMPQMDGIEATRAIRQLPGWQQVPVAALTADVFTETREACLAAGMSEFLGKPVDADKLYPWLLRVLDAEQAH
jgi:signal transduction histidine kinase/ActR/RegA family two-component response regulator